MTLANSSGIINAAKFLIAPPFPYVPLVDDGSPIPTLVTLLGMTPGKLRNDSLFSGLFDMGITDDLALVLVAMQQYEKNVQLFIDGALPNLNLARMCDERNLIQHTLSSQPKYADLPAPSLPRSIYEPTRLAMIIYSLTVIFPLPAQTAPISAYMILLKEALQDSETRPYWSSTPQSKCLLVWILMIGAAAARDMPKDRSWFVAALRRLTLPNGIKDFEFLKKEVLSRILWLDLACDVAGKLLWAEIEDPNG